MLFFEQRRTQYLGGFDVWTDWETADAREESWKGYVQALIRAIQDVTGGVIDMPSDFEDR